MVAFVSDSTLFHNSSDSSDSSDSSFLRIYSQCPRVRFSLTSPKRVVFMFQPPVERGQYLVGCQRTAQRQHGNYHREFAGCRLPAGRLCSLLFLPQGTGAHPSRQPTICRCEHQFQFLRRPGQWQNVYPSSPRKPNLRCKGKLPGTRQITW